MIRRQLCFPALLLLLCVLAANSQTTPAFPTSEDLRHFRGVLDPRLSPDGKQVLYRVQDATADGGRAHLWLTDLAGNTSRQITFSPSSDKAGERNAEWMRDGSILFLAKRGEHTQLFRLPAQFGEAQPYDLKVLPLVDITKQPTYIDTSAKKSSVEAAAQPAPAEKREAATDPRQPIEVSSFAIAPDGKQVAIIAEDPASPAETKQKTDKADAVWVNHDIHGRRLYLLDPRSGNLTATSVPPNVGSVSWSADSSRMLILTGPQDELDDLGPREKAYVLEADRPDQPSLLDKLPPTIGSACWSQDGNSIYFVAQARRDAPPGVADLYHYNVATQQASDLTDGFDGSVGRGRPIALLNGGVLEGVAHGVQTSAAILRPGQTPEVLRWPTPLAGFFSTNARQSGWVYIGDGSTQPLAVYYTDSLSQPPHAIAMPKLTPANDRTVPSKRISYHSEKFTIEGLLYLPPQAANAKVPLIVDVHGGPTGAFQDAYDPFVGWLNGQGWAVFRANIRGSANYGAEFAAANKNDLGGGDYRDLMNGVDYVLKNFPLDESRMALMGYSYGGEMAGFVEGKTDRFKAIISGAPVIDQFSEYGTEFGSWYDRWFYGRPWEHFEDAWRQSPLAGAAKASTPFLLLQGAADRTDPQGESQQMYRALRQMGVPVELVIYPREDHGPLAGGIYGRPVSEPWHGLDARRHIQTFLQKAFGETK